MDTMNFCFWSDEPSLFTVQYRDQEWTGYRAMVAAITKAVEVFVCVCVCVCVCMCVCVKW